MFKPVALLILTTFIAESEGISATGGIYGKKRNKVPGLTPLNRFLCPGCAEKKKELEDDVKTHCMKGDKGDKGEPGRPGTRGPQGPEGTFDRELIKAVIRPLQAKVDALVSSYTTEIARLRNEVRYLKSNFVHTLGSEENPAKSCKEIYEHERYSPSGAYYLNITGVHGGTTRVYCFMEEGDTCPAGSTLVLKIDGAKDTFKYSSPLWSNKDAYSEENGFTLFDSKETKLASYWGVSFSKVCVSMRKLGSFDAETLVIEETSTSLYDILADGKYRATKGGKEIWKTLLTGSQLQSAGCYREGFNAHGTQLGSAGARIGVIAGNQSNCTAPNSFIGFGTEGGICASSRRISCGNEAGTCNQSDVDTFIPAFGYIFIY